MKLTLLRPLRDRAAQGYTPCAAATANRSDVVFLRRFTIKNRQTLRPRDLYPQMATAVRGPVAQRSVEVSAPDR